MNDWRAVKLMSDYGCSFPLWPRGAVRDATPEALHLSGELTAALLELQQTFDECFHYERGWFDRRDEERYARLAVEVWGQLRLELGEDIEVLVDLWPVQDDGLVQWLRHQGMEPHPGKPS